MSMQVTVIGCVDVPSLLPMGECIEVVDEALRRYSQGECDVPLRSILWLPDRSGGLGMMPGYAGPPESRSETLGMKVVSIFPRNEGTKYESHQGVVLLFDVENGRLLAVMDGGEITTIRTAAASAVATRALAREDARTLAILGTGTQARSHLAAMRAVRPIESVRVWGRHADRASAFAQRESARHGLEIETVASAEEAVREADVVCTVTGAREPILSGQWLRPGTHINAVGACIPVARELDADAVQRSRLYVDSRESATSEAGDYLIALREGAIDEGHIVGEIGEVLLGRVEGRRDGGEITVFESLGIAAEDLATARHVYAKALLSQRGTQVAIGGLRHEAG